MCHRLTFDDTDIWVSYVGRLNKQNQFLLIGGEIIRKYSDAKLDFQLDFKVEIMPVDDYGQMIEDSEKFKNVRDHTLQVQCRQGDSVCDRNFFVIYPQIEHAIYKVGMQIELNESTRSVLEGIYFSAYVVSERYTKFLMSLRYSFFGISVVLGIIYLVFYFKIPKTLRTFEHKAIAILTVLLVFFNDPFYYLTIYKANGFLAVYSTLAVILFLTFLLLFWIVMI